MGARRALTHLGHLGTRTFEALRHLDTQGTLFGRLISNVLWGLVLIMDILSTIKYNIFFPHNLEFIQRNSAKVITTAIRGKSRKKICNELGFEFLKSRRKYRELCCFYKVFKLHSLGYLFDKPKEAILQKNNDKLPFFKVQHNYLNLFPLVELEYKYFSTILIFMIKLQFIGYLDFLPQVRWFATWWVESKNTRNTKPLIM